MAWAIIAPPMRQIWSYCICSPGNALGGPWLAALTMRCNRGDVVGVINWLAGP